MREYISLVGLVFEMLRPRAYFVDPFAVREGADRTACEAPFERCEGGGGVRLRWARARKKETEVDKATSGSRQDESRGGLGGFGG